MLNYSFVTPKTASKLLDKLRVGGSIFEAAAGVIHKFDAFIESSCNDLCMVCTDFR